MIRIDDPRFQHHISPYRVKLDWRAYWQNFKEAHGGNPVPWSGRLLFPDGWMYSASDYRGPEFRPEQDQVEFLQLAYWVTRKRVVRSELLMLTEMVKALRTHQGFRSARIMQTTVITDDETGKRVRRSAPLDTEELEQGRMAWLKEDLGECQGHINRLSASLIKQRKLYVSPEDSQDKVLDDLLSESTDMTLGPDVTVSNGSKR